MWPTPQTVAVEVTASDVVQRRALGAALAREGFHVCGRASLHDVPVMPGLPRRVILIDARGVDASKLDALHVQLRLRRAAGLEAPVLMFADSAADTDLIGALDAGADDYVAPPCDIPVIAARVCALARRGASAVASGQNEPMQFGAVVIDPKARVVTRSDIEVRLRPKEFDLLTALARRPGTVFTRDVLLAQVWGTTAAVTRTVDTHILELRRKLEEVPSRPRHIVTVWKHGFRFDP